MEPNCIWYLTFVAHGLEIKVYCEKSVSKTPKIFRESGMPSILMEPLKPSLEEKEVLKWSAPFFCFCLQENYLLTFLAPCFPKRDPEPIDSVKQERRAGTNRGFFPSFLPGPKFSRPLNLSQVTDSLPWPCHSPNPSIFTVISNYRVKWSSFTARRWNNLKHRLSKHLRKSLFFATFAMHEVTHTWWQKSAH